MEKGTLIGGLLAVVLLGICVVSSVEAAGGPGRAPQPTYGLNFYRKSCPAAENIIRSAAIKKWNRDKTITAGLLRMFFHDCFVTVSL
jgi:peroxidase